MAAHLLVISHASKCVSIINLIHDFFNIRVCLVPKVALELLASFPGSEVHYSF
jgi:hypothetical protein